MQGQLWTTDNGQPAWKRPAELPRLTDCRRVALDLETWDPHLKDRGPGGVRRDGYIVGVSLAVEDRQWYFPIRHPETDNYDPDLTMEWLMDLMKVPGLDLIGANCSYDMEWLDTEGVNTARRRWLDVQIAAALLDENRLKYSLDSLGEDYLGARKEEAGLYSYAERTWGKRAAKTVKEHLWRMPASVVGPYAEQDARLAFDLWREFEPKIEAEGLRPVFELEAELQHLLLAMRKQGVRVDLDAAEQLSKDLKAREQAAHKHLKETAGQNVDVWANASIANAFDKAGVTYPRTAEGAPSFTKKWLEEHDHALAVAVSEVRRLNKLRSGFVDGVVLKHNVNGRVYTLFRQTKSDEGGTVSGRLSASNPNLQQIPARDPELARLIRALFLPEPGERWALLDYSQVEPRITLHYAAAMGLRGTAAAVKLYQEKPETSYHKMVADMTGLNKDAAKIINLGLAYGMGLDKLALSIGCSTQEAEAFLVQYHEALPFLEALNKKAKDLAAERGYIKTLFGRRSRFTQWTPWTKYGEKFLGWFPSREACLQAHPKRQPKRGGLHKALNRLIQGTAADIMKLALVEMWRAGIIPCLTVHDETDKSVPLGEEGDKQIADMRDIMQGCVKLNVPLLVKIGTGHNWGTAEHD